MKTAIICSQLDLAGINVRDNLLELFEFEEKSLFEESKVYKYQDIKLYTLEGPTITAEDLDKKIVADVFIFASKHASKEGVHSLSCHSIGNWDKAQYGGKEKTLCPSDPLLLKKAFLALKKYQDDLPSHQITLEATHHGPYMKTPSLFIEIGSNEKHWKDKEAGKIIANVIMQIIKEPIGKQEIALCLGGGHYCHAFNKILERTDIAISHICPKHHLASLDENLLKQTKFDFVLLDWKGLGKEKQRIIELLEKLKIKYKRTDKV